MYSFKNNKSGKSGESGRLVATRGHPPQTTSRHTTSRTTHVKTAITEARKNRHTFKEPFCAVIGGGGKQQKHKTYRVCQSPRSISSNFFVV